MMYVIKLMKSGLETLVITVGNVNKGVHGECVALTEQGEGKEGGGSSP